MLGNLIALLIAAGVIYAGYRMLKHLPPFDK
jgi:hypothetical protein